MCKLVLQFRFVYLFPYLIFYWLRGSNYFVHFHLCSLFCTLVPKICDMAVSVVLLFAHKLVESRYVVHFSPTSILFMFAATSATLLEDFRLFSGCLEFTSLIVMIHPWTVETTGDLTTSAYVYAANNDCTESFNFIFFTLIAVYSALKVSHSSEIPSKMVSTLVSVLRYSQGWKSFLTIHTGDGLISLSTSSERLSRFVPQWFDVRTVLLEMLRVTALFMFLVLRQMWHLYAKKPFFFFKKIILNISFSWTGLDVEYNFTQTAG